MKDKVNDIVINLTRDNLNENANSIYISNKLKLSRNLISQYLNELYASCKFVKINTRPVIFYDIATIENQYNLKLTQREFKSVEELKKSLIVKNPKDFEKLIGYNESLRTIVNQCKATISYPPDGLPLLLHGPTGTGKSFMAQLTYEYAVNNGLIEKDKKFLIVNCSEYANNPELLTANLFGHKKGAFTGADRDNPGLIKLAEDGVLFMDEVHCLNAKCQEKLFLFMDKGIYHMVGDNKNWYKSKVHLIFATTENPEEVLLKTLLRRIPMIIKIPSLEDRGSDEKLQLIYNMFLKEENKIKKSIFISSLVYDVLLKTNFVGNIGALENCIQASCVNAFFKSQQDKNKLEIHAYDLPENLLEGYEKANRKLNISSANKIISIYELKSFIKTKREILDLNDKIIDNFETLKDKKVAFDEFLENSFANLNKYYDSIVFNEKKASTSELYSSTIMQSIFEIVYYKYGIKFYNNDIIIISNYLEDYTKNNYEFNDWNKHNLKNVNELYEYLEKHMHREFCISNEILQNIHINMDIKPDLMVSIIFILTIKMLNNQYDLNKNIGVIIAHGYSTASSMANAANKLLNQYIFDSIDMPLDVTTGTIINKLNNYLNKVEGYEQVVLLVDMGSLEEIYKGIQFNTNSNIAIMNNVNTKLALEVGEGIKNNLPLEEILETAKRNNEYKYQIIKNRLKEKVILCSCASGIGTAEKLRSIIEKSLPKDTPIKVLTYNYNTLIEKRLNDDFFEKYNIICIVGTLNPYIDEIKFIPIEDLILDETLDYLNLYFEDFLSKEEINIFKQNILINFSLSNIMNNLTILNPARLLEQVADALDKLQELLNIKLNNTTCVGLYVHICCLIERLITKQTVESYADIDKFISEHLAFIKSVKNAFNRVEKYYRVNITTEEIAYMYDYIKNDKF